MSDTPAPRLTTLTAVLMALGFFFTAYPFYTVLIETPRPAGYTISDFLVDGVFHPLYLPALAAVLVGLFALRGPLLRPAWRLWPFVPLALLGVWQFVTLRWSIHAETTLYGAGVYVLLVLAGVVVYALTLTRREYLPIVGLLVMAGTQALLAVLQAARQGPLGLYALGEIHYDPSVVFGVPDESYRAPGLLYHPNVLGGVLLVGFLLAVYLMFRREGRGARVVLGAVALLTLAGIGATQSRSALLGLLVAVGVFAVRGLVAAPVRRRALPRERLRQWQTWAVVSVLLGGGVALSFAPPVQALFARFWLVASDPLAHVDRLLYFVPESLRAVDARPWRGFGTDVGMVALILYNPSLTQILPAHNVFVWLAVEGGYTASILFTLGLLVTIPLLFRRWEPGRVWLVSGVLGVTVVMFFDHYFWIDNRTLALLLLYLAVVYGQYGQGDLTHAH